MHAGKEETSLSLVTGHVIIYVENATESIKKLLELKSEFNKLTEYKVCI